MVWTNILWGMLLITLGVLTLKFNYSIVGFTGNQDWIEDHLGGGSTYLAYKIFSIILVLIGLLLITGFGGPFLSWILSPLRGIFGKGSLGS